MVPPSFSISPIRYSSRKSAAVPNRFGSWIFANAVSGYVMTAGKKNFPFTWMNIGLSLQMNSANSDTMNIVIKSHSAQYPRRLALKFSQRRLLSGESAIARRVGGAASPIGDTAISGGLMPARTSTSDLPRLEVDARIDPCVSQVGNQV